jgi:cell division protein WhiA
MSYSLSVKNEAVKADCTDEDRIYAELTAIFRISGNFVQRQNITGFEVATENAAFARRVFRLVKRSYKTASSMETTKNKRLKQHHIYTARITNQDVLRDIAENMRIEYANGSHYYFRLPGYIIGDEEKKKAYIRGAFLASGSVSNPKKTYHLEITAKDMFIAQEIAGMLEDFGLNPKILGRRTSSVVYIKEGEHIKDFLGIIGAYNHLMEFENIRILKEMRNNVNRLVNCETSNLDKTVDAGVRQLEDIRLIDSTIGLKNLPETLFEIASLRLGNEDLSLLELSRLTKDGIGKSGVNHRMKKISQIASEIREKKIEKSVNQKDQRI